jgi:hypothetical protein
MQEGFPSPAGRKSWFTSLPIPVSGKSRNRAILCRLAGREIQIATSAKMIICCGEKNPSIHPGVKARKHKSFAFSLPALSACP